MRQHRSERFSKSDIKRFKAMMADEMRFLRTWMGKPLTTGAVSPSGRSLARAMAARVELDWPGCVVELGPGTGAVTAALLERGVPPERLVAIEYNPDFAMHLRERFPGIKVIVGDAYALKTTLALHDVTDVSAVISSLPLFTRPPLQRTLLMQQAMELIPDGRPFVQFSYALVPPVPANAGTWTLETSDWILKNLPPARVWTYTNRSGHA